MLVLLDRLLEAMDLVARQDQGMLKGSLTVSTRI
jgi:hypothetical protein